MPSSTYDLNAVLLAATDRADRVHAEAVQRTFEQRVPQHVGNHKGAILDPKQVEEAWTRGSDAWLGRVTHRHPNGTAYVEYGNEQGNCSELGFVRPSDSPGVELRPGDRVVLCLLDVCENGAARLAFVRYRDRPVAPHPLRTRTVRPPSTKEQTDEDDRTTFRWEHFDSEAQTSTPTQAPVQAWSDNDRVVTAEQTSMDPLETVRRRQQLATDRATAERRAQAHRAQVQVAAERQAAKKAAKKERQWQQRQQRQRTTLSEVVRECEHGECEHGTVSSSAVEESRDVAADDDRPSKGTRRRRRLARTKVQVKRIECASEAAKNVRGDGQEAYRLALEALVQEHRVLHSAGAACAGSA